MGLASRNESWRTGATLCRYFVDSWFNIEYEMFCWVKSSGLLTAKGLSVLCHRVLGLRVLLGICLPSDSQTCVDLGQALRLHGINLNYATVNWNVVKGLLKEKEKF